MEDPATIGIIIRGFERVVAVLIGGAAIYFGYRLFTLLPLRSRSDGEITLPGASVVLSKVGPGVFFALFGSYILYSSIAYPVTIEGLLGTQYSGQFEITPSVRQRIADPLPARAMDATPQERARARRAVQVLNCLQTQPAPSPLREEDVVLAVRSAKIALLETVWDTSTWGPLASFKPWAERQQGQVAPNVQGIYEATSVGCPE